VAYMLSDYLIVAQMGA